MLSRLQNKIKHKLITVYIFNLVFSELQRLQNNRVEGDTREEEREVPILAREPPAPMLFFRGARVEIRTVLQSMYSVLKKNNV